GLGLVPADQERQHRGGDHPAHGRDRRQQRFLRGGQLTDGQLALELQADHEEEDGQQPVLGPLADGQVQVQRLRTDGEVAHRLVQTAGGGVGEDQGEDRGAEQHQPTGGFGAEVLGEVETAVFGVGLLAGGFGHASAPGSGQVAMSCRPDFPARPASTLTPVLVIASRVRAADGNGCPPPIFGGGHPSMRRQSSELLFMPFEIRSITEESASVVTSPISRFSATSRSRRRMILPERVWGSSGTTMICRGLAIGPISLETCSRSSFSAASPLASSSTPPRRMTNATMPWPVVGSLAPTTAASATFGCDTRAD